MNYQKEINLDMLRKATEIGNTLSQRNRIGKTLDYEDQGPKLAERSVKSRQLARIKDARLKLQNTQKESPFTRNNPVGKNRSEIR